MSQKELHTKIWEWINKEQFNRRLQHCAADGLIKLGVAMLAKQLMPKGPYKKSRIGNIVFDNEIEDKCLLQAKFIITKFISLELLKEELK